MNQPELYLDDLGVDILNVAAALVQMHNMQVEVCTGLDESSLVSASSFHLLTGHIVILCMKISKRGARGT